MAEEKVVRVKSKKSSNPKFKKTMISIITTIIIILGILFLMSGAVNQRKVLTSIINWFTSISEINGDKLDKSINEHNDPNLPVEINEDGIYIKGHSPSGSKDKTNDDANDNSNNENNNIESNEEIQK